MRKTRPLSSHLDLTSSIKKGFIILTKNVIFWCGASGNPEGAGQRHLACSGNKSQRGIRFNLSNHGTSHIMHLVNYNIVSQLTGWDLQGGWWKKKIHVFTVGKRIVSCCRQNNIMSGRALGRSVTKEERVCWVEREKNKVLLHENWREGKTQKSTIDCFCSRSNLHSTRMQKKLSTQELKREYWERLTFLSIIAGGALAQETRALNTGVTNVFISSDDLVLRGSKRLFLVTFWVHPRGWVNHKMQSRFFPTEDCILKKLWHKILRILIYTFYPRSPKEGSPKEVLAKDFFRKSLLHWQTILFKILCILLRSYLLKTFLSLATKRWNKNHNVQQ